MLAVPADRLPAALADLDPGNRALLDLSLRRGVSDAEIGELLRKEPADVARGRDAVLELLADALDLGGHDRRERVRQAVAALPDDAWSPRAPSPPAEEPEPDEPAESTEPEAEEEADEHPTPPPLFERERAATAREFDDRLYFEPEPPPRSRRGLVVAALGALAVLGALLALILSGGGDDDSNQSGSQPSPAQNGDTTTLSSLGGGPGDGKVSIADDSATITISGLPNPAPDSYQVWLYDSVVHSKSLGTFEGGSGRLEVKLPPDASSYRYLDVSREPDDANPNHSGDSVMRAPLGDIL